MRIHLLGGFRVLVGPHAVPDGAWRWRKARAVVKLPGKVEWLDLLEREHDNFRVALEWAIAREPDTGLRLAGSLGVVLDDPWRPQRRTQVARAGAGRQFRTDRAQGQSPRVGPDEAATYKPQNSLETSRELLYAEATLVTGAILGPLQDIRRITFTMARGEQVLATGDVSRSEGLMLTFSRVLGGGTYKKPELRPGNQVPGGDHTASEL